MMGPARILLVALAALATFAAIVSAGCLSSPPPGRPPADARLVIKPEWNDLFAAAGAPAGCALSYEVETATLYVNHPELCGVARRPASTFKIPLAAMALDAGVASDPDFRIAWDGVERMLPEWNRDQTLKSAFTVSAVWYFAELGRRLGPDKLQAYVDAFAYGNRRASGTYPYWLDGDLRISPYEQLAFLRQIQSGALPISAPALANLRRVMFNERRGARVLYAKTGLSLDPVAGAAWRVGFFEGARHTVIFSVSFWPAGADFRVALERRNRIVQAFLETAAGWR